MVTPAMRERSRVFPIIEAQANRLSQKYHAVINDAFKINKKGQIDDLAGIDPTLPAAPTIQDVAARLPTYRARLTEKQLAAMQSLENDLKPYTQMLDEAGVERGLRPDVMDGGFYIPRGAALKGGLDDAISVPTRGRGGGKKGFERSAEFESQTAGIDAGYKYALIGEVLEDYGNHAGRRALDLHVSKYLKTLTDEAGRPLAVTPADLIPPKFRDMVQLLRRKIAARRKTLAAQNVREAAMVREATRLRVVAEHAGERAAGAGERVAAKTTPFLQEDLVLAREALQTSIEEAQTFAFQAGENAQRLRAGKVALNANERKLVREVEELTAAIEKGQASIEAELVARQAAKRPNLGGLQRTVGAHLKDADQLTSRVNKLGGRAEKMSARVDELIERGDILREMRTAERQGLVAARQTERTLFQKKMVLTTAEREMRLLSMEHRRTLRAAERSGARHSKVQQRATATEDALRGFGDELEAVSTSWDRAVAKSKQTPQGYDRIPLAGLEAHSFPMELAVAANKVLASEGALIGKGAELQRTVVAYNQFVVGMNATADNSGPGIQGLLALYDNPRVFLKALRLNLLAWSRDGDRILGRFLDGYDARAVRLGRLTSEAWGTYGIQIGGANIGEFQLGQSVRSGFGNLPVIRHANRAFGTFGDTLRLEWADDMLLNELSRGRTLKQLHESGDLHRLAEIANNMTGHSRHRKGGILVRLALFAPGFLQARLTTLTRAAMGVHPGATLDQRIAQRSILRMVGFSTMLTVAINEMQGRDTDFRPWVDGHPNSNFIRFRFRGRDVSLMGTWDSIAKALMLTASGRPDKALRQLASPILRQNWDLTSGKTAVGERTRDNPLQFAYYMMKALSPFASQEVPEIVKSVAKGDVVAGGVTLVSEIFAIKSGPLGFTDQKDIVRRELFPDVRQKSFWTGRLGLKFRADEDLHRAQRRQIIDDPRVQEQIAKLEAKRPPTDIRQRLAIAFDDVERIKKETEAALRANIDAGMDGPDLRKKISAFKQTRFLKTEAIFGAPDIQAELADKTTEQPIEDVLAERYWTADAPEDAQSGELDFDLRDRTRESILAQADQLGVERAFITGTGVDSYRGKRYEDATVRVLVEQFEGDRERVKAYLSIGRTVAEERNVVAEYEEYLRSDDRTAFARANPILRLPLADIEKRKDDMRTADYEMERILYKWGYINAPKNITLAFDVLRLRREQGGVVTDRLAIDREPAGVAP
jgi:hypothetical protein